MHVHDFRHVQPPHGNRWYNTLRIELFLDHENKTGEDHAMKMPSGSRKWLVSGLFGLLLAAHFPVTSQPAQPAPPREALRLRVVGGLAGVSQYLRHEEPFWTRTLGSLSQGRYTADIVPFDRAGVPGQDMLTFIRLGVVPFGTALLGLVAGQYPELGA